MSKFIDRFIELPIRLVNRKDEQLLGEGNVDSYESYEKLLPMEISSYHPTTDYEVCGDKELTQCYLKGGRNFMAYLSISEFEKILNNHNL